MLDRHPLIAIAAQHETYEVAYNSAHQCIDSVSMAAPITKFSHEVKSVAELLPTLDIALETAMTPPMGPVFIAIPIDILKADLNSVLASRQHAMTVAQGRPRLTIGDDAAQTPSSDFAKLLDIVHMLRSCEHPLLVIGDAAARAGHAPRIVSMAEHLNVPVVSTYAAKGLMPQDHPLNYGVITPYMDAILEYPAMDEIFGPVDFMLLIAYDTAEHLYPHLWARGRKKIVARLAEYPSPATSPIFDIDIVSSLSDAIDIIMSSSSASHRSPYSIARLREHLAKVQEDRSELPSGIKPNLVLQAVNEYLEGHILVSDVGLHRHISALFFRASRPLDFMTSAGLSSFGTGLGLGIGTQLANPDRKVVVLAGDGGFHSSSGDLETVVRLDLSLTILVLNNSASSLIQRYEAIGGHRANPAITHFGSVDFAALAEANGCRGVSAQNFEQLREVLVLAKCNRGPVLVDVQVRYPDLYVNEFETNYHAQDTECT